MPWFIVYIFFDIDHRCMASIDPCSRDVDKSYVDSYSQADAFYVPSRLW